MSTSTYIHRSVNMAGFVTPSQPPAYLRERRLAAWRSRAPA